MKIELEQPGLKPDRRYACRWARNPQLLPVGAEIVCASSVGLNVLQSGVPLQLCSEVRAIARVYFSQDEGAKDCHAVPIEQALRKWRHMPALSKPQIADARFSTD